MEKNIKTNINILPFGSTKIILGNNEPSEYDVENDEPIYSEIKTTNTPLISLELDDFSCKISSDVCL